MFSLHSPTTQAMQALLASSLEAPLSYAHRGGVENPPKEHFIDDEHRVYLGKGVLTYQRACKALDAWQMFPAWTAVHPALPPQNPGQVVAMVVQIFGLWWINPCRILKRCDGDNRHGFVYGTLPEHAECGEERFMVEMLPDGTVWYEIRAFSHPRHWMAWMGFPVTRWWQLKFADDSKAAMRASVSLP